jgi:hypothetical protein
LTLRSILILASALIALLLGLIHLRYTHSGNRLVPRDTTLRGLMEAISPRITRETTMWRAWIGFNASHSAGLIIFGGIYTYLSICQPHLLVTALFLQLLGLAALVNYMVLARRYFFRIPFAAMAMAATLFAFALWL